MLHAECQKAFSLMGAAPSLVSLFQNPTVCFRYVPRFAFPFQPLDPPVTSCRLTHFVRITVCTHMLIVYSTLPLATIASVRKHKWITININKIRSIFDNFPTAKSLGDGGNRPPQSRRHGGCSKPPESVYRGQQSNRQMLSWLVPKGCHFLAHFAYVVKQEAQLSLRWAGRTAYIRWLATRPTSTRLSTVPCYDGAAISNVTMNSWMRYGNSAHVGADCRQQQLCIKNCDQTADYYWQHIETRHCPIFRYHRQPSTTYGLATTIRALQTDDTSYPRLDLTVDQKLTENVSANVRRCRGRWFYAGTRPVSKSLVV